MEFDLLITKISYFIVLRAVLMKIKKALRGKKSFQHCV